ncbi:hypothetical protein NCCP1664_02260 [Zafaria cholistanensis]|uniref:Uncharacterized protein n=1 Tax=Zafaria cholistanensis TaxID=1682741 RepID=A0A5A7NME5_9MICC|nr:hypothetical protein NCCP1664_02260 [Zafaria cholistanensis]
MGLWVKRAGLSGETADHKVGMPGIVRRRGGNTAAQPQVCPPPGRQKRDWFRNIALITRSFTRHPGGPATRFSGAYIPPPLFPGAVNDPARGGTEQCLGPSGRSQFPVDAPGVGLDRVQ